MEYRRQHPTVQYAPLGESEKVVQIGLSVDISAISNFVSKLALSELSRGRQCGISSLEEDFRDADLYWWLNRREGTMAPVLAPLTKPDPHKLSILRWIPVYDVTRDPSCVGCGGTDSRQADFFAPTSP